MRPTPIISMQVEFNIPPLSLIFEYLKSTFLLKLLSVSRHPLILKLQSISNNVQSYVPYLAQDHPEILKLKFLLFKLNFKFKTDYNLYLFENDLWPCYNTTYKTKLNPIQIIINNSLQCKEDIWL